MLFKILTSILLYTTSDATPGVINDKTLLGNTITEPSIGRGYSYSTGKIFMGCLEIGTTAKTTEPSFDYEYDFSQISNAMTVRADTRKFANSASYNKIMRDIESNVYEGGTTNSQNFIVWMKVDKYYHGIEDLSFSESYFLDEPRALFEEGEYLMFFQSCGPYFIRSVRRVSEMSLNFSLQSMTNLQTVQQLWDEVRNAVGGTFTPNQTMLGEPSKLQASVSTFGLDHQTRGFGRLRVESLEGALNSMDLALAAMMNPNTGMPVSIEVVSWVTNVWVQNNLSVTDELVENGSMISTSIRRFNLITNIEFILRMEDHMLALQNHITAHQNCILELTKVDTTHQDSKLYRYSCNNNENSVACQTNNQKTVSELLEILLGDNQNVGSVQRYALVRSIQRFSGIFNNYYNPCVNRLEGEVQGVALGNMQMYHWMELEECQEVSCTFRNTYYVLEENTCRSLDSISDEVQISGNIREFCPPQFASGEEW